MKRTVKPCSRCRFLAGLVNSGRQFIQQENVGIPQQRECDQQALKLSTGESSNRGFRNFGGNSHKRERLRDIFVGDRGQGFSRGQKIARCNRYVTVEVQLLWNIAELYAFRPANRALERNGAYNGPKEHRLPGAVRPDDSQRCSRRHTEAQIAQGLNVLEADAQISHFEDVHQISERPITVAYTRWLSAAIHRGTSTASSLNRIRSSGCPGLGEKAKIPHSWAIWPKPHLDDKGHIPVVILTYVPRQTGLNLPYLAAYSKFIYMS